MAVIIKLVAHHGLAVFGPVVDRLSNWGNCQTCIVNYLHFPVTWYKTHWLLIDVWVFIMLESVQGNWKINECCVFSLDSVFFIYLFKADN